MTHRSWKWTFAGAGAGAGAGAARRLLLRQRRLPERRLATGALAREADVDVVHVAGGRVDVLLALAVAAVAVVVVTEVRRAGAPVGAVPDELLDAHPAGEGVLVAGLVGGEQELDQLRGGGAGGGVPVD